MTIDWSKAPEGAQWHTRSTWYKAEGSLLMYWCGFQSTWRKSKHASIRDVGFYNTVTPRPSEPKPYTRDEALRFLVERLDSWPTDITDAPLCPGWGWVDIATSGVTVRFVSDDNKLLQVLEHHWQSARPDFVPFVSVEDAQPAPDMVNHPPHYQSDSGVECIDAIRAALGRDGFVSYCTGNAIKYLWRDKTDRVEDLRKAAWYLNRAIQEVSADAQTDR